MYAAERQRILTALLPVPGARLAAIEHIGSTAVPGLAAKPTIDIMAGLADEDAILQCIQPLGAIGYEHSLVTAFAVAPWHYLARSDAGANGERGQRYHLHLAVRDGRFWREHLLFRDCLRAQPGIARQYEQLKRQLASGSARIASAMPLRRASSSPRFWRRPVLGAPTALGLSPAGLGPDQASGTG